MPSARTPDPSSLRRTLRPAPLRQPPHGRLLLRRLLLRRLLLRWLLLHCCRADWAGRSRARGRGGFAGCLRRAAAHRGSRRLAALRLRGTRDRMPGGARGDRDEPVRRPGSWYRGTRRNAGTRPADWVVSGVQRRSCRRRGGPSHRVVQAIRPGNRGNPGRRPVAETARSLDDRTRPNTDRPAQPVLDAGSEAQDPTHRDVAAHGARGGDDRRAQLRAAKPRTGAAPGARAAPPARARASRPPSAMALHRNRDWLTRRIALLGVDAAFMSFPSRGAA